MVGHFRALPAFPCQGCVSCDCVIGVSIRARSDSGFSSCVLWSSSLLIYQSIFGLSHFQGAEGQRGRGNENAEGESDRLTDRPTDRPDSQSARRLLAHVLGWTPSLQFPARAFIPQPWLDSQYSPSHRHNCSSLGPSQISSVGAKLRTKNAWIKSQKGVNITEAVLAQLTARRSYDFKVVSLTLTHRILANARVLGMLIELTGVMSTPGASGVVATVRRPKG